MFSEIRYRLEGRLELLEGVVRNATAVLQGFKRGESGHLAETVRALKSASVARAEHHARRFEHQSDDVRAALESLSALRREMRRLLVERARALALQEDGSEEEIAARIAADPIRRFTELEWPPLAVLTRRGLCLALASLVATELAFFVDQSLAACVAAIAVGAWLWFIAAHAAYLRGPIILTRTRLIVGRRAFAIAEMRKMVLHILQLPSLEILHQDASTTTFSRPPRWLLDELRSQGVPCERRWGVLSLD